MDVNVGATQLRVVLVAMPLLVREIIRTTIAQEPDMCIVAEYDDTDDVVQAEQHNSEHDIDVVVLGVNNAPDDTAAPVRILSTIPNARVVAVTANGRTAALYVLRPQRLSLGEISPTALVHALRQETDAPVMWQRAG